jgi:hypothetical protein
VQVQRGDRRESWRDRFSGWPWGALAFHVVERLTIIDSAHENEHSPDHHHPELGVVSALALSAHSFSATSASGRPSNSRRPLGSE